METFASKCDVTIALVRLTTLSENTRGGRVFTESAHKSFVGKIFSDKNQLHTENLAKRGRWVYEGSGSEEKPTWKSEGYSVLQRLYIPSD